MIRLVGPGGSGKSIVGAALAVRLGIPFFDLDGLFRVHLGDISGYLQRHGYRTYANRNIEVYLDTLRSHDQNAVFSLSSGFLTYDDPHPDYHRVLGDVTGSPSTIALLASFDYEACVAETVRRQLGRPFSRPAEREEEVIRTRFLFYRNLAVKKFETNKPVEAVVQDLLEYLAPGG